MCNRHIKPLNVHLLKAHKGLLLPTHKIHNLSLSAAPFPACQENLNDSPAATPLRHVVNVVRQSLCKPAYSAATTPKHPLTKHHTPTIPCAKALPERNGRCECFDCQSSTRSCAGSNKLAKACCNSTQQKCAPTAGNHLSWKRFPGLTPPPLPTLEPKPSLSKRKTAQIILLMRNVRHLRCQHAGGRKIPCDYARQMQGQGDGNACECELACAPQPLRNCWKGLRFLHSFFSGTLVLRFGMEPFQVQAQNDALTWNVFKLGPGPNSCFYG